jgi:hypothetical protein
MMFKRALLLMVAVLLLPGLAYAQSLNRATFLVYKDFTDDNPGAVDVHISCNTGLPLDQTKSITEGVPVEFVIENYDPNVLALNCDISETVPAGYAVSYFATTAPSGFAGGDVFSEDDGCFYEDVRNGTFTCEITNTPIPVEVEVCKEWVYNASSDDDISDEFTVRLQCNAVIEDGYEVDEGIWRKSWNSDGEGCQIFTVHPEYGGNSCTASEDVYDSAVESDDSDCSGLEIDIAQGAECTIVNTVFFEGIPTLNQYGLALLALLMLGVGFVGFRRFA